MPSSKISAHDLDPNIRDEIEAQSQHLTQVVTLPVSGWGTDNTCTVTVSGVTENNTVMVAPAPSSFESYGSAGVRCTAQASNSLTFLCSEVPESDVEVNILILGV